MADFKIPELSLVVLVGASGSGKSTFAATHFRATEVLSSDAFRGMVADDETDQAASADAFAALHFVAAKRLAAGRLTVVDATNVQPESRAPLIALAREHDVVPVAIVLDVPPAVCEARNRDREGRNLGKHVVAGHARDLRRSLRTLGREGFRYVHHLRSVEAIETARLIREPAWTDKRAERGPFDVIGDVHGCFDELEMLLSQLGYAVELSGEGDTRRFAVQPPEGRRLAFVGDLVDRGPRIPDVLRLVMDAVADGAALCVPGNHEVKLLKKLRGGDVKLTHGLAASVEQLAAEPAAFSERVAAFLDRLVSHYVLDGGDLVVAHAGMIERYQGRASGRVRAFALFGDTTGETDEYGLPVRHPWAQDYRGRAHVVYGHTPVASPEWVNRTICIDTGCVFGGALSAVRWPEREVVSVPALRTYYEPARPLAPATEGDGAPSRSAQHLSDDLLDLADVTGRRTIHTRLVHAVTVTEAQAAQALEAMTRFTVPPQWLVYLPATMSPSETTSRDGLLEHPDEAFAYFRERGVERVVCEEKHMGSRAVLVVCRDPDVAQRRFGVATREPGVVFTRTGRAFFADAALTDALLERARRALEGARLWDELASDWVVLDAEILPWSAKAQDLIRTQYAAVGAPSRAGLSAAVRSLERAKQRGAEVGALLASARSRSDVAERYVDAYRRYCWDVERLDDLRVAPFHLLASEGAVHVDRDHGWHLAMLARLAEHDPLFIATDHRVVDLAAADSCAEGVAWWEALTRAGGEGMVVKPMQFLARGERGLLQPAIKCRGAEYLRIIYGPEYDLPQHLERLRARGLGGKRALAIRETALGIEALERFVRREPLRRVHECVFGVLALETEPVDPRL